MATGTGLDAQVGCGVESVWGVPVTCDRFYEFISESLTMVPAWLEPTALRSGVKFKRAERVRQSSRDIGGDVVVEHSTKGMGRLWKHALGSPVVTPSQIATTTAYEQCHVPGDYRGLGMTVQVGRPEPASGAIKAFTYNGCKVATWKFTVKDKAIPQMTLTFDGQNESTVVGLAVPTYPSLNSVFDFSQTTLKLGGTVSTTSGKTSIVGGAAVATIIHDMSLAGASPKDGARYGLGNAGLKAEQLENATPTITGDLSAEFNLAELYSAFSGNTTIAMQMDMVGAVIGASGANYTMSIILPAVKMKKATPNVAGPAIVAMKTSFEAYSDGVNPVIQVRLVSDEISL